MRRRVVVPDTKRRSSKPDPAEETARIRAKAQEYVDSGMPYQMAMSVVHGRMELNDALERLARRDRVASLMEKHDLSRALATQVALGHADLNRILGQRRQKEHRLLNAERTCLVSGHEATFAMVGGQAVRATVAVAELYNVVLQPPKGEPIEVHKLELKYAYAPTDWKKIRKLIKRPKGVEKGQPAERPQDRYTCSDKRLFGYIDGAKAADITLLDGDHLKGTVLWFSRYEMGVELKGGVVITLFRHALSELKSA